MTLVIVDALVGRGKWWSGLLVGLAISIKLTPAVFLLLFFLRRDWRTLVVSAVSAVAYAGIGYLVAPDDSVTYWTSTLFDTDRIGSPHFANNQSLKGELGRLGTESTVAWFVASLIVGLLIAWAAWRLISASEAPAAKPPATLAPATEAAEAGTTARPDGPTDVASVLTVAFAALFCSVLLTGRLGPQLGLDRAPAPDAGRLRGPPGRVCDLVVAHRHRSRRVRSVPASAHPAALRRGAELGLVAAPGRVVVPDLGPGRDHRPRGSRATAGRDETRPGQLGRLTRSDLHRHAS